MFNGSFHEAIGFLLVVGQIFGIMPVSGIRHKSTKQLKFKKFSIRFVYCIAVCVAFMWMISIEFLWIYRSRKEFGKFINFTFDISNLVSLVCFLELARKWPALMNKWHEVEKFLPQLKYQMDKQKLAYEIKMVSFVILLMSMGEFYGFFFIELLIQESWIIISFNVKRNIFLPSLLELMLPTNAQPSEIPSKLITLRAFRKFLSFIRTAENLDFSQNSSTSSQHLHGATQTCLSSSLASGSPQSLNRLTKTWWRLRVATYTLDFGLSIDSTTARWRSLLQQSTER